MCERWVSQYWWCARSILDGYWKIYHIIYQKFYFIMHLAAGEDQMVPWLFLFHHTISLFGYNNLHVMKRRRTSSGLDWSIVTMIGKN